MSKIILALALMLVALLPQNPQQLQAEVDASFFFSAKRIMENFEEMKAHPHNDDKLQMYMVGDLMLGRYVRTLMEKHGMDYPFEHVRDFHMKMKGNVDLMVGNLEGPILGEGRSGGTAMVFSFNEDVGPWLKKEGFDLVSLANNHAVDMGWDGYYNSRRVLEESGVGWCGNPRDVEEEAVYRGMAGKSSYAFVCLHDVTFNLDENAAVALIEKLNAEVDFVVVYIHWGYEYKHVADNLTQVGPAKRFVNAGADLVVGHHPHVVQNHEWYNDRLIVYSLGNYLFDQYWAKNVQEQQAIKVELGLEDGTVKTEVEFYDLKSERSQVKLVE